MMDGNIYNVINFTISDKQLPKRSHIKKELYRLLLARSDIDAARRACDLIIQNVKSIKDELLYPLTTAVVICYSRPFTKNKPYGPLPNKWSKFKNKEHKLIHKKLLKARNELFAHSDMTVRKAQIVPPNIPLVLKEHKIMGSPEISTQVTYTLFEINSFQNIKETILDFGTRIQLEINKLINDLYFNMELPNDVFDIRIDEGL